MSRDLDSLARGPLAIAGALVVALAALWALVTQGYTQFIVPPPEEVGQIFFTSLKAHNFGAAHDQLGEELAQKVSAEDLRTLTARLDRAGGGIEQARGEEADLRGQSATATIMVKLKDGSEQEVDVPLSQEHGLWHITSLAPLEALIGSQ